MKYSLPKITKIVKFILPILCLFGTNVQAENVIISVGGGFDISRNSNLNNVKQIDQNEIATGFSLSSFIGYRFPLFGNRLTISIGVDYLGNKDGDWGASYNNGGQVETTRQLVRIQSIAGVLSAKYDITQVKLLDFYPVIGAGLQLQHNKLTHQSILLTSYDGVKETTLSGCIGDDTSKTMLGWHVLGGVGRDFGPWSTNLFYKYTNRGHVKTASTPDCMRNIPSDNLDLNSHEIQFMASYAF